TSVSVSLAAFVRNAGELFRLRTIPWVLVGAALMAFASGGFAAWFFEFLKVVKGMSEDRATLIFGVALLGGLVGVLAGGVVGDALQRRAPYGRLAAISL